MNRQIARDDIVFLAACTHPLLRRALKCSAQANRRTAIAIVTPSNVGFKPCAKRKLLIVDL
jgi:hypothetical protein